MCSSKPPAASAPAAAPPPPEAPPEETELGAARKAEEDAQFGANGPTTRVDRSLEGGLAGGAGLKM